MNRVLLRTMATDFLKTKEKYLNMALEEKRQGYSSGFVDPATIPAPNYGVNTKQKYRDITSLEVDAIVNAANSKLAAGGGVCGAIHRAAGKELAQECASVRGGCPTGSAVLTGGYRLPAKYVIHAVGPQGEYPKELEATYRSIMKICEENNLKSVAIPCISTGIYGYPQDKAAAVAVNSVLDAVPDCVEKCILCTFLQVDTDLYTRLLGE